jgi:hypothetical protein
MLAEPLSSTFSSDSDSDSESGHGYESYDPSLNPCLSSIAVSFQDFSARSDLRNSSKLERVAYGLQIFNLMFITTVTSRNVDATRRVTLMAIIVTVSFESESNEWVLLSAIHAYKRQ